MMNKQNLSRLPASWLIALVALFLAYTLLQPKLNQRLGWNLPSIVELTSGDSNVDQSSPVPKPSLGASKESEIQSRTPDSTPGGNESDEGKQSPTATPRDEELGRDSHSPSVAKGGSSTQSPKQSRAPLSEYEYLTKVGNDTYRSPAGLIYKRGSEEGHRLKHIQRHLADIPSRPGPHGVFDGAMVTFLQTIDEAYSRAKKNDKGTSMKMDEGRTMIDVNFPRTIGFLGGQEGKRKKYPKLKRLKIVVDEDALITAYPF